ncbi:hypothetical protein Ga0466249_000089 [Sporomusaceae bacterium BoRhaA]|uniref:hypothetical protein n=1 Tax=Pelorhabdus rhamnosifermentans TaxID=2772457 RepID=UPI001C0637E3|nr:hypothetical protein [Pelorhabdus rhamnosifermentans]MBU2699010.1 hypothetical protein [Pelorhabdus rhamnosifermentans]
MSRKIIAAVLLFCLLFTVGAFAQGTSTELTALDKLTSIEKVYYGAEQTGSLVERTNRLEKDVYGNITKDALMVKVDRLYDHTKTNSSTNPSFILKLNAVEWSLMHNVTTQPGKARIEDLEKTLTGSPSQGAFDYRLNSLLKLAYSDSHVDVGDASIRQDSLIKVKLVTPLSSKDSRPGDSFTYAVSEDVFDNGLLVIAKGAMGQGRVKKVDQAGNFGRDAKLELSFDTVEAVDGTVLDTLLGDKAKEKTNSMATAAGASAAGMVILGPVGILGGAFVHGHDVVMPVDTELYIQTKTEAHVYGIRLK